MSLRRDCTMVLEPAGIFAFPNGADTAYMQHMVQDHQKGVAEFQKQTQSGSNSAESLSREVSAGVAAASPDGSLDRFQRVGRQRIGLVEEPDLLFGRGFPRPFRRGLRSIALVREPSGHLAVVLLNGGLLRPRSARDRGCLDWATGPPPDSPPCQPSPPLAPKSRRRDHEGTHSLATACRPVL